MPVTTVASADPASPSRRHAPVAEHENPVAQHVDADRQRRDQRSRRAAGPARQRRCAARCATISGHDRPMDAHRGTRRPSRRSLRVLSGRKHDRLGRSWQIAMPATPQITAQPQRHPHRAADLAHRVPAPAQFGSDQRGDRARSARTAPRRSASNSAIDSARLRPALPRPSRATKITSIAPRPPSAAGSPAPRAPRAAAWRPVRRERERQGRGAWGGAG